MVTANDIELKLIDKTSSEFAKKELKQIVEKSGSEYFTPKYNRVVEKANELDFFHITLPESVGGSGLGHSTLSIILKNICTEDSSLGAIMLANTSACEILLESKKESLLKDLIENQKHSKDFLLGFPLFSSPAQNPISVTATETSSGYLLSGQQEYLVLAGLAEKALIPATIKGETGFAYFLTDLTQSGVNVSEPVRSLGITACPISDVTFDKVLSSKCCEPIDGNKIFNSMTRKVSIAIAAMETGIMTGSFKEAIDYTNSRSQGGRKIIHWSDIKKTLSVMAINIQVAEMLLKQCRSAIENNEKNRDADIEAAVTRISEMACEVTSDGIRVMGGVGYMKDFNQEKRFRDSRHIMSTFGMMQMKKLNFLEKYITKSAIYNRREVIK